MPQIGYHLFGVNGKKKSGQELFSGRSKRNKNLSGENLHQYRMQKVSKGRRTIRRQHYFTDPQASLWDCMKSYNPDSEKP